MKALVTGGAGFIGSNLVDKLLGMSEVIAFDNLSNGKREYINKKAKFIEIDLLNDEIDVDCSEQDILFHLAANPDVRLGAENTQVHLEQNIIVTHKVLEAARKKGVKRFVFTSTSTVYGEATVPTCENYGPLLPISLYGASKLSCEALISAYCHTFGLNAWIYRFANVVGRRSNHGVIFDFIQKLKANPEELHILGDGKQTKSYIYIDDCITAMLYGLKGQEKVNIFNIGSEDQLTVSEIAVIVSEAMGLKPRLIYSGGTRGWKGDVPVMQLSIEEIKKLGWRPKYSSWGAVHQAVMDILEETK